MHRIRVSACLVAGTLAGSALAQTITVNTVEDYVDFKSPQTIAQLPGPDGFVSMAEACMAANNTAGPQTIAFAIPKDQWWLIDDIALLRQENLFLLTDDGTTIDFTTQTAFTGDTNPDGNEVGIYGVHPGGLGVPSIWIQADNCVIKGLGWVWQRGNAIRIEGNHNRVIGCVTDGGLYAAVEITGGFGGPSPHGNIIGGTGPGEGNWLTAGGGGVSIVGPADHNIVIGNVLTGPSNGIEVIGATQYDMIAADNRIGGPSPAERNFIYGAGKYGEEGFPTGVQVDIQDADRTTVEGNYIGVNESGARPARQVGPGGVGIRDARGTIVRNNLISGLRSEGFDHYAGQVFGVAISLAGEASGTVIQGNLIGTNPAGTAPVPTRSGIVSTFWPGSSGPSDTLIGGAAPGEGNTIAFTETVGISLFYQSASVTISGNSIHDNGGLGIDLQTFEGGGVTPNDALDTDTGANGLQNFPVLASAIAGGGPTTVSGDLDSTPSRTFTLEFFASPAPDPSGYGEGAVYLGSAAVTTDAAGHADFQASVAASSPGAAITSTATDRSTGDTSEFSAAVTSQGGETCRPDCNGDGKLNINDFICFQNEWRRQTAYGDYNGDGKWNINDFVAFQSAFAKGCP